MEEEEEEDEPEPVVKSQNNQPLQENRTDYDSVNQLQPPPSNPFESTPHDSSPEQIPDFKPSVSGVKNKELEKATWLHDQIQGIY